MHYLSNVILQSQILQKMGTGGHLCQHPAKPCKGKIRGQRKGRPQSPFSATNSKRGREHTHVLLVSSGNSPEFSSDTQRDLSPQMLIHWLMAWSFLLASEVSVSLSFLSQFNFGHCNPWHTHMASLRSLTSEPNPDPWHQTQPKVVFRREVQGLVSSSIAAA